MTPGIVIRDVVPGDAEELVRILNPIIASGSYTVLREALSVEAEREYVESFPEHGLFRVAQLRSTGAIAGFASVEPFASYTPALSHVGVVGTYVDLSLLRRGIGTALAQDLAALAPAAGFKKFFTYIRCDNPGSIAFYLGMGFTLVGTAEKHARIGDACVDELIVEKLL